MKVLLVHNFYQSSSPSGEDAVYRNEAGLLRSREVAVVQYERHNDGISGPLNKAKAVSVRSGRNRHTVKSRGSSKKKNPISPIFITSGISSHPLHIMPAKKPGSLLCRHCTISGCSVQTVY